MEVPLLLMFDLTWISSYRFLVSFYVSSVNSTVELVNHVAQSSVATD